MQKYLITVVIALYSAAVFGSGLVSDKILSDCVSEFNAADEELFKNEIDNSQALAFLRSNIPLFECPDSALQKTYYFRWWTYRKHIKKTGENEYVITEFLPKVPWSGLHNAIACPAAFHFGEGRWLKNPDYLKSYARYWYSCGKNVRLYSFWPAHAILEFYKNFPDIELLRELYPKMKENFAAWESEKLDSRNGLFWQTDNRDGMEVSISGKLDEKFRGYRATINSYMYGESLAISEIATLLGEGADAKLFSEKADEIKRLINDKLWDGEARFYKVIPYGSDKFSDARELHGYTPWYFSIPPFEYSDAWKQLSDSGGFKAPYGPTTAEQRHSGFEVSYTGHECQWNGPSWPYATTITLVALANFINDYPHCPWADKHLYFETLQTYAMSHRRILPSGERVMWIDENLNPYTGDWISRTRLENWNGEAWPKGKGGRERGKDYNHSEFCNLIISGLLGIRPEIGNILSVNPIVPDSWDWFCIEDMLIKGRSVSVFYDKTGEKYGKGKGLFVIVDGKTAAHSDAVSKLKVDLSQ